jgi:hypothetical protein
MFVTNQMSAREVEIANKLHEAVEDAKIMCRLELVLAQALADMERVVSVSIARKEDMKRM